MKVQNAYILYIDEPTSIEYRDTAAESCEKIGLPYIFWKGWQMTHGPTDIKKKIVNSTTDLRDEKKNFQNILWEGLKPQLGFKPENKHVMFSKAAAATAGHFEIWNQIKSKHECSIILEHDAIMYHKPEIHIPDNQIVCLGYKFKEREKYNYVAAGPPKEIKEIKRHAGAHAYAITHVTATSLLDELKTEGVQEAIDNYYFMRDKQTKGKCSKIPLTITDPICALGWLRKSTIWGSSAVSNYDVMQSFRRHSKT